MAIIIFLPILVMMMVGSIPWKKIGIFVAVPIACVLLLACIASIIPRKSNNSVTTVAIVESKPQQKSIGEKIIGGTVAALNRFRFDTWVERVKNHVDIAEKWTEINSNSEKQDMFDSKKYKQVMLARCAIYNGKVADKQGEGLGPGNSTWRNRLPAVSRDFVYALIVEEYSWLGALGVIFLYMWLLWRAGVLIRKTDTVFSAVVIVGAAMVIVFQAFVHIGVNVGVLPVTGQTLPLLSQGGTSIWVISAFFGLILGMSKRAEEGKPQAVGDKEKADENTLPEDNTDKKTAEPTITPINSEFDANTTEFVITEI
jgi:cell division protein FtsW